MKYTDTFLYWAAQYVDPTVTYFVGLATLLVFLIALRFLITWAVNSAQTARRRKKAIQRAKNRMTEKERPITDPWLNSRDVEGHTAFEKTIRLRNHGLIDEE